MSLRIFVSVLFARWFVVLGIFVVVVASTVTFTVLQPKQYTSTASVIVDTKTQPVEGQTFNSAEMLAGYIATQVDIVGSARVARRVVKLLKLDESPQMHKNWASVSKNEGDFTGWLAALLQKKLAVIPSRDSNVINIAVQWPEPKMAAALADAFARVYIETNIELRVEPAKQFATWFAERSRLLHEDLERKQKLLSDYEMTTGIVATDEKLDLEGARLAELSSQLVAIQAQRQESQSRQQQVSGDNAALPEVLQSPVIASLKDDLARAEAKRPDIAARLGKNHPDYQAVEAEIEGLQRRLAEESAKIAASLGSATKVNIRRESDIRLALEDQKKLILRLKQQHDTAANLQADVSSAQRDLATVAQHEAQSSLESQMQQSNVVLLAPAVAPTHASSPKLFLNLVISVFLGGLLGITTALLIEIGNPLVRDDAELHRILGVPLLGRIGRIKFMPGRSAAEF